jgi:hypothetical protein
VRHLKRRARRLSRRDHRRRRGDAAGEGATAPGLRRRAAAARATISTTRPWPGGAARQEGLDLLHPAPPADRLQPRRLADRADGEGRRRRPRQPRRQARSPQADASGLCCRRQTAPMFPRVVEHAGFQVSVEQSSGDARQGETTRLVRRRADGCRRRWRARSRCGRNHSTAAPGAQGARRRSGKHRAGAAASRG